jgi:hypothetical protein
MVKPPLGQGYSEGTLELPAIMGRDYSGHLSKNLAAAVPKNFLIYAQYGWKLGAYLNALTRQSN